MSQATISHHLKELADAGLIEPRAAGQFKLFRARAEVLAAYIEELQKRAHLVNTRSQKSNTAARRRTSGKA